MYSARNYPSLAALLPKLKSLGYGKVEGYGGLYDDKAHLAEILLKNHITMPSGHFSFDQLQNIDEIIQIANRLGIKTLICPWLEPEQRPQTKTDWVKLSASLENLATTFAAHGFNFAWHNHDFEFIPLPTGEFPMDILLQNAPTISWQFDVAWSVKADQDPTHWIEKHGARIISVHVKDIAPKGTCLDEDGWADVGQGVMDWKGIFAVLKTRSKCKSFVMEHDNPGDVIRFASRSIEGAKSMGVML